MINLKTYNSNEEGGGVVILFYDVTGKDGGIFKKLYFNFKYFSTV